MRRDIFCFPHGMYRGGGLCPRALRRLQWSAIGSVTTAAYSSRPPENLPDGSHELTDRTQHAELIFSLSWIGIYNEGWHCPPVLWRLSWSAVDSAITPAFHCIRLGSSISDSSQDIRNQTKVTLSIRCFSLCTVPVRLVTIES